MPLPSVRFPPFSNKLKCYESCTTHAFQPYTDGIEKYITDGVDLKVLGDKSLSIYAEFIEFIKKISLEKTFTLHISNDVIFDEVKAILLPIDNDFEKLFFEIIELFNDGQIFNFEFQYKIEDKQYNIDFLNRLVKYLQDNENIQINSIILGEDVTDEITFRSLPEVSDFIKNLTR